MSMNGLDRRRRKALLAEELSNLGRKVALRSFTGVLAKQRQTICGADLVSVLERAGESWVAVVTLNQKAICFLQPPLFGADDCLSRMAELPQEVDGIAMPAGILDFGHNIPDDCIDLFHIGEGSGWGSGQCYPMLDLDDFGSVQLEKPAWQSLAAETFEILRAIIYPLVLRCLKNYSSMTWPKPPKTVGGARAKAAALEQLVLELEKDKNKGGYSIDFRTYGHGCARDWLRALRNALNRQEPFTTSISQLRVSQEQHEADIKLAVAEFKGKIEGRNRAELQRHGPIVKAYWKAVKVFGFRSLPLEILEADPMDPASRPAGDGFDDVFLRVKRLLKLQNWMQELQKEQKLQKVQKLQKEQQLQQKMQELRRKLLQAGPLLMRLWRLVRPGEEGVEHGSP